MTKLRFYEIAQWDGVIVGDVLSRDEHLDYLEMAHPGPYIMRANGEHAEYTGLRSALRAAALADHGYAHGFVAVVASDGHQLFGVAR